MVQDSRGGKLGNAAQVIIVQIGGGVKAAAGKQGELDAGRQGIAETHVKILLVKPL